jgi:protein TonB
MISRKTTQADIENKRSTLRALGFIASLSLVLIALSWTSYDVITRQALNYEADLLEDEEIPINIVTPPPPPPPPQQTTVIEIVDDEEEIEIELEIEDIELDEDTEIEIIEEDDDVDDDTPFMIVENMPALAQCKTMRGDERHQCTQMEIIKYVSKNTKYPPIAKDAGIQGTVFVYPQFQFFQ